MEVMRRRGRRLKQLLDDLKETKGYWKLKERTLHRTLWRIHFGRGVGPGGKQTPEWAGIAQLEERVSGPPAGRVRDCNSIASRSKTLSLLQIVQTDCKIHSAPVYKVARDFAPRGELVEL